MDDVKSVRAYSSAIRHEGAQQTRRAIVAAAWELFLERGYAASSLRDIAGRAGVARPTVTAAFGSKPALLRQITDEALAGDEEPIPVAQRSWFLPVVLATTPGAVLEAYADACVLISGRTARLFEVVHRACAASPEIAQLWETLQSNRRAGAGMVVEQAMSRGRIRDDLESEQIADSLWTISDPAQYRALVLDRGWSRAEYLRWLIHLMRSTVLEDYPAGGTPATKPPH